MLIFKKHSVHGSKKEMIETWFEKRHYTLVVVFLGSSGGGLVGGGNFLSISSQYVISFLKSEFFLLNIIFLTWMFFFPKNVFKFRKVSMIVKYWRKRTSFLRNFHTDCSGVRRDGSTTRPVSGAAIVGSSLAPSPKDNPGATILSLQK